MSKRLRKRRVRERGPGRTQRLAVFTSYGTREHVECVAVAVQEGGIHSGGRVLDSRRFWSRDFPSAEELMKSALRWALAGGATKVAQVKDVLPLEGGEGAPARALN